ncbi:hypothetical protein Tco_0052519 [Tanacetum coccineum]
MVAFTSNGLSMIPTKLGNPNMLDSYTSYICMESWGRGSFAYALIELYATCGLKDMLVVVIPNWKVQPSTSDTQPKDGKQKDVQDNGFQTEDNGNSMDDLVDDTRKKLHYFDMDVLEFTNMDQLVEEAEHRNGPSKQG